MSNRSKYCYDEKVEFYFDNGTEEFLLQGKIAIINEPGSSDPNQVSYDIYVIKKSRRHFYKHVNEADIIGWLTDLDPDYLKNYEIPYGYNSYLIGAKSIDVFFCPWFKEGVLTFVSRKTINGEY